MRTPRVMPHTNKSFVNTSARSLTRSSAKAMKSPRSSRSRRTKSDGTSVVLSFLGFCLLDLVFQTGILG